METYNENNDRNKRQGRGRDKIGVHKKKRDYRNRGIFRELDQARMAVGFADRPGLGLGGCFGRLLPL